MLGPFAGALLDRWDRRLVLIGANLGRLILVLGIAALLAAGASDLPILFGALIVNGFTRFVSSGLSAALPDVVPRDQVVTMNSVATATGGAAAFLGAAFMLVPRWLFGADDTGAAAIIFIVAVPVSIALLLSVRFPPHVLGPHESVRAIHGSVAYAVATGWLHGARTVLAVPTVAGTLAGLAAHRMVLGINTMLVLVMVRHGDTQSVAGFGTAALFFFVTGIGAFLANVITPARSAGGAAIAPPTQRCCWRRSSSSAASDCSCRCWCCAGSCSARPVRWSNSAPTPPCRSTSTTRCAATCSPCRTRCSGCRSSPR